ncbi:sigma-70 family RNA polymerase sigma factor [Flavobacteriaceae bacterium F08102]|nr:sigma-70 family RNA polymerase sigma factor [Flavobacteriaceae bacterium F08102]
MTDYLAKIKEGDEKAFKAIFELYYEPLCSYLRSFTRDLSTAEDLAQMTFVTLWRKRAQIEIKSSLKSYLFKMGYNNFLQMHRNLVRENKLILSLTSEALEMTFIEDDSIQDLKIEQLNKIIQKLPPASRRVLELKQKGIKNTEISSQLDLSIKTVESHVRNAFKIIRKGFKNNPLFMMLLYCTHKRK